MFHTVRGDEGGTKLIQKLAIVPFLNEKLASFAFLQVDFDSLRDYALLVSAHALSVVEKG